MNFLITENKLHKLLLSQIQDLKSEAVCDFFVEPEMDENEEMWIVIKISEEWALKNRNNGGLLIKTIDKLVNDIKRRILNTFGLNVRVASYVTYCTKKD